MALTADKLRQGAAGASAGGYEIANSLRFNDDDSAYLSRTPSSAGNRKTWTWSGWVKLGDVSGGTSMLFTSGAYSSTDLVQIVFDQWDISFEGYNTSPSRTFGLRTTAEYRDPSAWYHIVAAVDTTQATSSDRVKLYVNGSQVTDLTTAEYPTQNYDTAMSSTIIHTVGNRNGTSLYYDGYLAEVNFVDGQALDPSNFGETGDYGEWKPIKYTGTYGTNGFYLSLGGVTNENNTIVSATGGTVTTSGDYKIHTFTSSGTFTVNSVSGQGFIEALLVAGGGGGGNNGGGGGGAGGVLYTTDAIVSAQSYSITIGAGGNKTCSGGTNATQGGNSTAFGLAAVGGGRGGSRSATSAGGAGGSGGGTCSSSAIGGAPTSGQGNYGGYGYGGGCPASGGGGGGAGAIGEAAGSSNPGNGGVGRYFSQFTSWGESGYFGGGGAGAQTCSNTSDSGGTGGGGDVSSGNGAHGTANTGGGGGGGGPQDWGKCAGNGGSGIVIIKYKYQ